MNVQKSFLLDTNAYFNYLKHTVDSLTSHTNQVDTIKASANYISTITEIEIISALGKHSRSPADNTHKCDRILADGSICTHSYIVSRPKPWKKKVIFKWLELIKQIREGKSTLLKLNVIPFGSDEINEAQSIIQHALVSNFGSLDAIIAATAQSNSLTVVTSDKGLKSCLRACGIPYWDAFN